MRLPNLFYLLGFVFWNYLYQFHYHFYFFLFWITVVSLGYSAFNNAKLEGFNLSTHPFSSEQFYLVVIAQK